MASRRRPATLTHLDAASRPVMVDVGDKAVTHREAVAEARIKLPPSVARALEATGHRTKKGPVFDTAVIAGVQAVKRTHELIPVCHPLPLEHCELDIDTPRRGLIVGAIVVAAAIFAIWGIGLLPESRDTRFWIYAFGTLPLLHVAWFLLSVPITLGVSRLASPLLERVRWRAASRGHRPRSHPESRRAARRPSRPGAAPASSQGAR